METIDRIVLMMFATLLLAVVFVERNKFAGAPAHVKPPPPGKWLLERTNVPLCRDHSTPLTDVAYEDVSDAAATEPMAPSV
jgi:hypothetical protein